MPSFIDSDLTEWLLLDVKCSRFHVAAAPFWGTIRIAGRPGLRKSKTSTGKPVRVCGRTSGMLAPLAATPTVNFSDPSGFKTVANSTIFILSAFPQDACIVANVGSLMVRLTAASVIQ
jgi:hypothetical protein